MRFLSDAVLFSCQAHSPGAHILEVFFVRAGPAAQKGSLPPFPSLLCCVCSCPNLPQPSCTTLAPYVLSFPSLIPPLHPNPPFFFLCAQALKVKLFGFHKVPKHHSRCNRCPHYPSTHPNLFCFLIASPFFWPACRLNCKFLGFFLVTVWAGTKKVFFLLPSPSCHVSCLPRTPRNPSTPLASLLPFLNPLNCVRFSKIFFILMFFFRLCSHFFGVPLVADPSSDVQQVPFRPLYPPPLTLCPNLFSLFFYRHTPGLGILGLFWPVLGIVPKKVFAAVPHPSPNPNPNPKFPPYPVPYNRSFWPSPLTPNTKFFP